MEQPVADWLRGHDAAKVPPYCSGPGAVQAHAPQAAIVFDRVHWRKRGALAELLLINRRLFRTYVLKDPYGMCPSG